MTGTGLPNEWLSSRLLRRFRDSKTMRLAFLILHRSPLPPSASVESSSACREEIQLMNSSGSKLDFNECAFGERHYKSECVPIS